MLEKSINNGISAQNDELIIDISQVDCLTLVGNYYHELTVVDREKGRSTVFKNDLTFEPTKNREE